MNLRKSGLLKKSSRLFSYQREFWPTKIDYIWVVKWWTQQEGINKLWLVGGKKGFPTYLRPPQNNYSLLVCSFYFTQKIGMHVLDANELFGVTSYTYDRIMEEGGKNGPDAFALYFKLMKQARIQETNQTFTLNQFLKNFFGWGHERLAKAKNVLKKLGLVDDVLIRSDDGKLQGHYIRVNYLVDEQNVRTSALTYNLTDGLENRQSVSTECGQTDANALSTKIVNAGNTQLKYSEKKIPSVSELVEAYRNTPELVRKIKDESVVKQRAEYKQSKKSKAYKTVRGFIQQLVENVTIVSYGDIRYDIGERLSYAQTKCIDGDNVGIWRDERMEKGFATWKKFNSITNKQNEGESS